LPIRAIDEPTSVVATDRVVSKQFKQIGKCLLFN